MSNCMLALVNGEWVLDTSYRRAMISASSGWLVPIKRSLSYKIEVKELDQRLPEKILRPPPESMLGFGFFQKNIMEE